MVQIHSHVPINFSPRIQTYCFTWTGPPLGLYVIVITSSLYHICCWTSRSFLFLSWLMPSFCWITSSSWKLPEKGCMRKIHFLHFRLKESLFYPHAGLIVWLSTEFSWEKTSLRILEKFSHHFLVGKSGTLLIFLICAWPDFFPH